MSTVAARLPIKVGWNYCSNRIKLLLMHWLIPPPLATTIRNSTILLGKGKKKGLGERSKTIQLLFVKKIKKACNSLEAIFFDEKSLKQFIITKLPQLLVALKPFCYDKEEPLAVLWDATSALPLVPTTLFVMKGTDTSNLTKPASLPTHAHEHIQKPYGCISIFIKFLLRLPPIDCLARARPTLWWARATRCGSTSKRMTPAAPWDSRCPTKVRKLFRLSFTGMRRAGSFTAFE